MWILLGGLAIIATCLNLFLYATGKKHQLAMVLAFSFTALTLVSQYRLTAAWVKTEDWGALADVVPTMEVVLWVLTIMAILLNCVPVIFERKNIQA